jgi:hypothetical protein
MVGIQSNSKDATLITSIKVSSWSTHLASGCYSLACCSTTNKDPSVGFSVAKTLEWFGVVVVLENGVALWQNAKQGLGDSTGHTFTANTALQHLKLSVEN